MSEQHVAPYRPRVRIITDADERAMIRKGDWAGWSLRMEQERRKSLAIWRGVGYGILASWLAAGLVAGIYWLVEWGMSR